MDIIQFQQHIWDLFHTLSQEIGGMFRIIIESFGITMVQMRIMIDLKHNGQRTVGDLSEAIGSAQGNTSSTCKTLEKKGLVTRTRNPEDERIVLIALTEKGKNQIQAINKEFGARFDPVLKAYSEQDYEQIITGLTKLQEVVSSLHNSSNS